ncbi:MAG: LptE family protein [Candidatus Rokubacteria bacterium]|nr:LptE family protein [Candidatus Rokubacteria bacterium]MBI3825354.1 LptE family protein [Candidatus Rokubacteria bacterium]
MRRGRLAARLAAVVAAALLLGGCGYSLRGNLPSHLKTIGIPLLANKTSQPNVENFLTRALVEAFSTNGRLRVVRPEEADSLLEGEVTGYQIESIAFDPRANVRQYRLVVTLNLRFTDVREQKVLFARSGYQERADLRATGVVTETISLEESAARQAGTDIARAIVNFTLERF